MLFVNTRASEVDATTTDERRVIKTDIDTKLRADVDEIERARSATDRFGDPISTASTDSLTIAPRGFRVNKPSSLRVNLIQDKVLMLIVLEVIEEMTTPIMKLALRQHHKEGYCTVEVKFAN